MYYLLMTLLGIDYGSKRIGLAVSDEEERLAFPHSVLQNDKKTLGKIKEIVLERGISKIILGESVDFSGEPNKIMKKIIPFKKNIEDELGLPVFFQKETFSTVEAGRIQEPDENIDARAAAIILQGYLDTKK